MSPSSCTECATSYFLYKSHCLESCPDDTFPSAGKCEVKLNPSSRQLQSCGPNCYSCASYYSCNQCYSGCTNYGGTCSCGGGGSSGPSKLLFFLSITFKACPSNCDSCSSSSSCDTCSGSYLLYSGKCYSGCPVKTWKSSSTACSSNWIFEEVTDLLD